MNIHSFLFRRSFFAVAAQCLRCTDVLVKRFFFLLYDENFYENFRETLTFILEKGEVKQK